VDGSVVVVVVVVVFCVGGNPTVFELSDDFWIPMLC